MIKRMFVGVKQLMEAISENRNTVDAGKLVMRRPWDRTNSLVTGPIGLTPIVSFYLRHCLPFNFQVAFWHLCHDLLRSFKIKILYIWSILVINLNVFSCK